jgi:hypothetical protein
MRQLKKDSGCKKYLFYPVCLIQLMFYQSVAYRNASLSNNE